MKIRLAILHFLPIECYPPIQNFLHIVARYNSDVRCFTTNGNIYSKINIANCKILRFGNSHSKLYLSYVLFYIWGLIKLIIFRPKNVLYCETISSLPALIYKKINPKARLFIHYHEYSTIEEYQSGALVSRLLHNLEKKNYSVAHVISQTNEERMLRFCKDNNIVRDNRFLVIPNYPPRSWRSVVMQDKKEILPCKMIYVGYTLHNETMFVDEIFDFVKQHKEFTLDCYLGVIIDDLSEKIKDAGNRIIIHPAIPNEELPNILPKYSIGLMLYRGHIPNYVYCASNKLFEYLSADLDVWFPKEMKGSYPYITNGTYPKVVKLDFENLDKIDIQDLISREKLEYMPTNYFAEDAFEELINRIKE
jgi:hypothetical protein